MTQFSLHGLTEQSTEIKALKRGLEKGTGQIIVSVELDKKLKKIDDVVTRGVSLFFEQGQSLYVVFRKNGDHIQIKQNGKLIPFSGQLNYANSLELFHRSVNELAGFIRDYQQKFDKLQARKNLKQIDGMVAKNEKQRKIAVSTQIKQLTELSASLDSEIATMTEQNTLLESEVLQLEQQSVAMSVEPISEPKDLSVYTEKYDDLRTAVHEFFKENLKGKVVKTVIGDVHILGSSWQKKLKQNVHIDEIKAKSIPFIPQILMQGDYEGRTLKNKVRKDDYIAFHAFNKEIQIDDNNVIVRLLVGERENNQYEFVVYSLYPNKKSMLDAIENPTMVASENAEIMLGSEHILHDDDDDVNMMLDDVRDGKSGWNIEIVSITPINQALSTEPTQNDENTPQKQEHEYRPHGKDLTFVGLEFDHTPTGDTYTVWGLDEQSRKLGLKANGVVVETVNMGKPITTMELAEKVAEVMQNKFGVTNIEIRSDKSMLQGGAGVIKNAFGSGGLAQNQPSENTSATNEPTKELFDEYKQKAKQYGFNIETEKHHFLESGKFYIKKGQYVNDRVHHSFELNANVKSTPVFSLTLYKEIELETIETIVADDFDELLLKASQWIERTDTQDTAINQNDIEYLKDIADGNFELTVENMNEHINKIEQIAERLGDEHEDLIEKAVEKYTEFALSVKVG